MNFKSDGAKVRLGLRETEIKSFEIGFSIQVFRVNIETTSKEVFIK